MVESIILNHALELSQSYKYGDADSFEGESHEPLGCGLWYGNIWVSV